MQLVIKDNRRYLRITEEDTSRHPVARKLYDAMQQSVVVLPPVVNGGFTWQRLVGTNGHIRQLKTHLLDAEESFKASLQNYLNQIGETINRRLQARVARGDSLMQAGITEDLFGQERWHVVLESIIKVHAIDAAITAAAIEWAMHQPKNSAQEVRKYIGKGFWDLVKGLPVAIIDAITGKINAANKKTSEIIESIKNKVRDAIGESKGDPAATIGNVAEIFGEGQNTATAAAIAVTEATEALGVGGNAAAGALMEAGLVNGKRWMTLHGTGDVDERVRKSHKKANGQTVPMGEMFILDSPDGLGVEYCEYPGDSQLSIGNRRCCRCLSISVLMDTPTYKSITKSYFDHCPRDKAGHCLPKDRGNEAGHKQPGGQAAKTKPHPDKIPHPPNGTPNAVNLHKLALAGDFDEIKKLHTENTGTKKYQQDLIKLFEQHAAEQQKPAEAKSKVDISKLPAKPNGSMNADLLEGYAKNGDMKKLEGLEDNKLSITNQKFKEALIAELKKQGIASSGGDITSKPVVVPAGGDTPKVASWIKGSVYDALDVTNLTAEEALQEINTVQSSLADAHVHITDQQLEDALHEIHDDLQLGKTDTEPESKKPSVKPNEMESEPEHVNLTPEKSEDAVKNAMAVLGYKTPAEASSHVHQIYTYLDDETDVTLTPLQVKTTLDEMMVDKAVSKLPAPSPGSMAQSEMHEYAVNGNAASLGLYLSHLKKWGTDSDVAYGESLLAAMSKPSSPPGIPPEKTPADIAADTVAAKKPVEVQPTSKPGVITDMSSWKQLSGALGSNPGGKYEAPDGKQYYVKFSKSEKHAYNEVLTAKLYEVAGAPVADYQIVKTPQGIGTAASWVDKTEFDSDNPQHKEAAVESMGVHTWLANWDAIGHAYDNQCWVNGKLTTIDTGGGMFYRAQGKEKEFNGKVTDIYIMLDPKYLQAAKVFGQITPEQKLLAFKKVAAIPPGQIANMIADYTPGSGYGKGEGEAKQKLYQILIDRQNVIKEEVKKLEAAMGKGVAPVPVAAPMPKNAPPQFQIPPPIYTQSATNGPSHNKKIKELHDAAMTGNIKAVELVKTNSTSKQTYVAKQHQYKMAILTAMKSGAVPSAVPAAKTSIGTQSLASLLDAVPKPSGSPKKADALLDAAKTGDIAAVQGVSTFVVDVTKYKSQLIDVLNMSVPTPASAQPALSGVPVAPVKPKFDPDKITFPDVPVFTSSKIAQNEANMKDIKKLIDLAHAGDLASLQTFQSGSVKVNGYKASLINEVEKQLNPPAPLVEMPPPAPLVEMPPPPQLTDKSLAELGKAFGNIKHAKNQGAQMIGYYMVVDAPGVPINTNYEQKWYAEKSPLHGKAKLNDAMENKRHLDAFHALPDFAQTHLHEWKGSSMPEPFWQGDLKSTLSYGDNKHTVADFGQALMDGCVDLKLGTAMVRYVGLEKSQANALAAGVGLIVQEPSISEASMRKNWDWNVDKTKVKWNLTAALGSKGLYINDAVKSIDAEMTLVMPPGARYLIKKAEWKSGVLHLDAIIMPTVKEQFNPDAK